MYTKINKTQKHSISQFAINKILSTKCGARSQSEYLCRQSHEKSAAPQLQIASHQQVTNRLHENAATWDTHMLTCDADRPNILQPTHLPNSKPSDSKASDTREKGLTGRRRLATGFLAAGLATAGAGAVLPRAPRRAHRHQGRPHGAAPPEPPPNRRRRRRREGGRRGVPRREAGSAGLGVVEGPHVGERGLGRSVGSGRRDGVEKGVCLRE